MSELSEFLIPIGSGMKPVAGGGLDARRREQLRRDLADLQAARATAWREIRGDRV